MTRESVVIDKEKKYCINSPFRVPLLEQGKNLKRAEIQFCACVLDVNGLNVIYNAITYETSLLQIIIIVIIIIIIIIIIWKKNKLQKKTRFKMPHLHKMSAVLLSAKQGKTSLRKKKEYN